MVGLADREIKNEAILHGVDNVLASLNLHG